MTMPGRAEAVQKRLEALLDAIKTVRPALATFYGLLNDEQKARFNLMAPPQPPPAKAGDSRKQPVTQRAQSLSPSEDSSEQANPGSHARTIKSRRLNGRIAPLLA